MPMGGKLLNVEAGRGIAAILVVLYHIDKYYFGTEKYWTEWALGRFFSFGNSGVEFFFVLSGFIMASVHWGDLGNPVKVRPFVEKRFLRLFPFYWLCLLGALALLFALPGIGQEKNRDLGNILASIVLVGPEPLDAVIFVSWTLFHEVLFYALFATAIWRPVVGLSGLAVWTGASLFSGLTDPDTFYMLKPVNTLFVVGVGCGLLLRARTIPRPTLVALAGAGLFLTTGINDVYGAEIPKLIRILGFGLGSALMLLGSVEAERSNLWTVPRFMAALGAASYSIYLTHMFLLTFVAKTFAWAGFPAWLPTWAAMIALTLPAIGAGVVVHRVIEMPLIDACRRIMRQRALAPA